ncbi:MAG TPA: cellulose biosynthesis cyclic di-GMP-binding regulatory protein BcsB [Mucilaginibacter sp.]|jgi:hypothetical protein
MNRFFTLLTLVFLLSKASLAQSIVSFKSTGREDNAIYGMSGASSFYFKISPLTELNGSKLVLYFETSQALVKEHSFINIILNNRPAYSARLTKDSIQKVSINLSPEDVSVDKFLKVQVKTLLTISDDACHDIDNPGLWIKIKNYSYLSLIKNNKLSGNINISNCFDSKSAIVYPSNPSLHDLKAVAWAYSVLKKSQNNKIQFFEAGTLPDSIKNYIEVGKLATLPEDKRSLIKITPLSNEGLFYLDKSVPALIDTASQTTDETNEPVAHNSTSLSEILFVTGGDDPGYEKAITALGNRNILSSTFGDHLLISKAENILAKNIEGNTSKLWLQQIGGTSDFLSGIGSLKSGYSFKNSDFSFTPKEIEIHFIGNYSGLAVGDRGYFNVYLNGLLISSEKLDASGKLNTTVNISRYQHHKYNTLESEFRFFPSNGACKNSFTNFFGEIDADKSYLESKNPFISNDLSFYQYPEAFNNEATRIVISKKYAKYVAGAVGEIIYELNNNLNSSNFPEFVYSDRINPGDLKRYNIIALLDKDDPLLSQFPDAPIKFDRNFRLYNTDENKVIYSLSDTLSTGLAQIFYGRSNNATLVLTATGKQLSEAFLAASRSITEQLSTLSSNVCVTDVKSNKYLFNINKSSDNIGYDGNKSPINLFWDAYNLYILLGILILILLSFLYVRSRVHKSHEQFVE